MITPEQQARKDAQDLRYLCQHFDAILDGMRQRYERIETMCAAMARNQHAHIKLLEQFLQAMAARLEALEGRVDTLEEGERW